MHLLKIVMTMVLTFSVALSAQASSNLTPESQALLTQLENQIQGTLLAVAENESKAGHTMDDFYYFVDLPAKQQTNLGLVVDVDNANKGYAVVSVTPGSSADQVAIEAGDRIVAINELEINRQNHANALAQLKNIAPGKKLRLALANDEDTRDVELLVKGDYVPGIKLELGSQQSYRVALNENNPVANETSSACGTISVFYQPPATRDLYSVYMNKVDNERLMNHPQSFRVAPGKHRVYVNELINDPFFPRRTRSREKAKYIDIDVKPNTIYYLAAKLDRNKRYKTYRQEYWEPVVWKTKERSCSM